MKRLTSNNIFEMNTVQLALNQVYISDGWAWYRGGTPECDVSVCDLIRAAADALGVELPMLSDDALSDLMADWLQYGVEEPEGVLAILYRALCAMAEVRARLAAYEDTGLGPEEITTEPYGRWWENLPPKAGGGDNVKIKMLETVRPDFPFLLVGVPEDTMLVYGEVYDATQNKHGAVCGICENGQKLGVKPGEFEIVEEMT